MVAPSNKGHVGTRSHVLYREVSFIWRLKCAGIIGIGTSSCIVFFYFMERYIGVLYSECPLSEVPL